MDNFRNEELEWVTGEIEEMKYKKAKEHAQKCGDAVLKHKATIKELEEKLQKYREVISSRAGKYDDLLELNIKLQRENDELKSHLHHKQPGPKEKDYESIVSDWIKKLNDKLKLDVSIDLQPSEIFICFSDKCAIADEEGEIDTYVEDLIAREYYTSTHKSIYDLYLNSTFIVPLKGGDIKTLKLTDESEN